MPQKKQELKDLRKTLLSRGFALARASVKAGSITASQWMNPSASKKSGWLNQIEYLVQELGHLKGTAMKVGQALSMYGENLLPKEVNEIFKKLQQNSPPVRWETMREVLQSELGEKLNELEIDQTPIAAASIGQVYKARVKKSGEELALKVQYPGVDEAVETDMKLLKFILNMTDMIPRGPRFDQIFNEIREMFHQEVNYEHEFRFAQLFGEILKDDRRYHVPKVFADFSTRRVIAYEFLNGYRADSPQVQALPLERRNLLGLAFFDLYLRELLQVGQMQTDPHTGNYLIEIGETSDRLVLFDFGAVRKVPPDFLERYSYLIEGGLKKDAHLIEKGGRGIGLLQPEDGLDLIKDYVEICFSLIEPFNGDIYDWGASDLPQRVAKQAGKIAFNYKLRAPPRELVFLDRKLGGVFVFLSVLKCKLNARPDLEKALAKYREAHPVA